MKQSSVKIFLLSLVVLSFCMNPSAMAISPIFDPVIEDPLLLEPIIDPSDIWQNPPVLDPCAFATFVLEYDTTNMSSSPEVSDDDSYVRSFAMPFTLNGEEAGFLKIEYDRITVGGTNEIRFVTCHDTFYFNDGLTAFGVRRHHEYGVFNGSGVITKVVTGGNEIYDIEVTYIFDPDDDTVCVTVK